MSRIRIESFSLSLDGYGAGPAQSLEHPLGVGGTALHGWAFETRTFRHMVGQEGGANDADAAFAAHGFSNIGAWVMGRNMFGPVRGAWPDDTWTGWWGDEPPYHCDVFVLTHHPRASFSMQGGTTFHFVTDGLESALARAREAAGGKDVRIGGGVSTIRQALQARLVDDIHLAVAPVLLGSGEALFAGLDLPALGYGRTEYVSTPETAHYVLRRMG